MKHILSIGFASQGNHFDKVVEFSNESVRISHYSTNFDFELSKKLINQYDGVVDAICISGIPPKIKYKGGEFHHPQTHQLKSAAKETIVVDGQALKDVYLPYALRQFYLKNSTELYKKSIGIYTGLLHKNVIDVLTEFENRLVLADPYYFTSVPKNLHSKKELETFLRWLAPVFRRMKLKPGHIGDFSVKDRNPRHLKELFNCQVFVTSSIILGLIDLEHLKGKTVITDFCDRKLREKLKKAGVAKVISCLPTFLKDTTITYSIVEGLIQAFQPEGIPLSPDDILHWVDEMHWRPKLFELNPPPASQKETFAFVIHPLTAKQIFIHPYLRWIKKWPRTIENFTEEVMSLSPGFFYGKIKGIRSEKNGREVEGLIYTVLETPKKMLQKDPETVYGKLVRISNQAADHGAGIIGLGAYTKIVGDAGITVASRSPIPVTTGNSLSAASTLWAARYAIEKMGFISKHEGRWQGTAMIVGATGSIGAVSAKVLAKTWKKIYLVAPRGYKLLELKDEIKNIAADCEVEVATNPNRHLGECDLIITTTSAKGKKVLEIDEVKPGCVICDVSRPFDIQEEDALRRPDVLVIASGEVKLPGDIDLNVNIGLHGDVVYACLAETALLAMEGRLESFTLSRNISYEKVIEIDRMAREHGLKLSAIMGHNGVITEEEFDLCRKHAEDAHRRGEQ